MAQDTALLRYLLKGARRAPGSGSQRDLAFRFDGTDDYISSNATIGRTGYNMNVSGNVSTGSDDGDGSYIQFNGNRDSVSVTGTVANVGPFATPVFNQTKSFTIKCRVKFLSFPANNVSGVFGSYASACMHVESVSYRLRYTLRGSTDVNVDYATTLVIGTLYDFYMVYDATTSKFYAYYALSGDLSNLVNVGGTTGPTTFSTTAWNVGDSAFGAGSGTSCNKQIYHACTRNKALTQAEIDADIDLGNTAKSDPSIVAYYIPENLQYETQYLSNPKALNAVPRASTGSSSVTANTTIAPDGTTTADTVTINGTALEGVQQLVSTISGLTITSKTFIVKAFVKVPTGTALFRLKCTHDAVADYFSSNLTATTTRQEFTFTKTFTSSTSGTGIIAGIVNSTGITNPILEVRNVRLFLTNETLRDESPNIGGFIGWKTQKVLSCRVKPNVDGVVASSSQPLLRTPRLVSYIVNSTNDPVVKYDNRFRGQQTIGASLGSGFRGKVHYSFVYYRDNINGTWAMSIYKNGILDITQNKQATPPNSIGGTGDTLFRIGIHPFPVYFSGNIRDARIYTFTGSFTDADALAIYNGGEPTSSGITKYLHYRPPVGEVGTTTQDQSPNGRDGTLNGGVTRDYI